MTATQSLSPVVVGGIGIAGGATVAVALDRLYARLGYHEQFPENAWRTRTRMVGYGVLCGLAAVLAVSVTLWLPLALLLGVLAVAVRRELTPPPEFVPIQELEPSAGPEADATVVENGLVLAVLLREWHIWASLALLVGVVEVGARAVLGWPVQAAFTLPLTGQAAVFAAVGFGASYPLALVFRRPWRKTSFGDGPWYFAVGFWAFAWGGAWLTISLAAFLLVRFGLVLPLAALVAVLVLAHLPPDEGDAPLELVLLGWPLGLVGVGLLAGVEWILRVRLLS